ncbi:MAG TPA: cbb3-type cytochrome c oxidase subunit I [Verrucomicrobiae bacterium]|jgi:cytochrome c oxidase cbb3-type subunit 1|nr:cbb3-type cytochrome c oxidase subunit I [Verrucomicrobiae bacterium]
MNEIEKKYSAIDASCRVPLLVLFGVASVWLIIGLALAIIASLTFHKPELFANCPFLTYGRVQPAANDAIVYGFAIPAALGVILWIFARLSESELLLPLVPIVAANIWLVGVLVGVVAILIGDSTGFMWLEFPTAGWILIFIAFLLIAISAMATFGARRERALQPAHWFLLGALFWFPWTYGTANFFLVEWPVRGVAQAVINWWFANNLLFVWLGLVGLGVVFYLLPKISGRPLQSRYFALFAFWTWVLFTPWCGMPQGAPVPSWLPAASTVASLLTVIPLISIAIVFVSTIRGVSVQCKGGPYCSAQIGTVLFLASAVMLIITGCSHCGRLLGMTWYMPAQTYLQIFGFFSVVICGAANESLPGVLGFELPFPSFVRWQHRLFIIGSVLFLALPLAIAGIIAGIKMQNPNIPFTEITQGTLNYLRVSSAGFLIILLGSLLFAINVFAATAIWQAKLAKSIMASFGTAFEAEEVKS